LAETTKRIAVIMHIYGQLSWSVYWWRYDCKVSSVNVEMEVIPPLTHPQLSPNFKSTVRKAAKYDIPFIQLVLWVTSSVRLCIITLEFIATGT